MRKRTVGRTISTLVFASVGALSAASCGSSGVTGGSTFDGGDFTDVTVGSGSSVTFITTGDADNGGCVHQTCASQKFTCGTNADGCGGAIDCGTCTAPEFCGGGGRSRCGTVSNADLSDGAVDGGPSCIPQTCASLGFDCGFTGDGCGGSLQCGTTCPGQSYCGGGGPNKCGGVAAVGPDGGLLKPCVPTTCAAQGFNCGPSGDGCGKALDCSANNPPCVSPQFCGGAGPSQCGGDNGLAPDGGILKCVPSTCADLGFDCGPAGDGCGGTLDCGDSCPGAEFCGGGGPSKCGMPDGGSGCVPQTCGANECGQKDDGCGNLVTCPVTCVAPDSCGGGGTPFQCGHMCTGLCTQQVACAAPATTTLSGTVLAGVSTWLAGKGVTETPDPVPNVLVYIPNDPLPLAPMGQGYSVGACPACSADVSGDPLVSTFTAFDGTFTLSNVPVGAGIPVVIQMGRWRRVFSIDIDTSCGANSAGTLNLPQNQSQGDIPLTAISTGTADQLECVLLKMGIDQAEFTSGTGTGRIHIYGGGPAGTTDAGTTGAGNPGATVAGSTTEATLMDTGGTLPNYDQLMLPCWGDAMSKSPSELQDLVSYADSGGHFFATHFSYTWLYNNGELAGTANWDIGANPNDVGNGANGTAFTGNVSLLVPPSPPAPNAGTFANWLGLVTALTTPLPNPTVTLSGARHDVDTPATTGSVDWIDGTDPNPKAGSSPDMLLHYTFNTPVPGGTCGHAIFSDFHVTGATGLVLSNGKTFPAECTETALTSQEKILEYMIWDLGSCVGTPPPPVCNKLSCGDQNITCGPAGDGCGGTIDSCGTCAPPLTCGGGGVPGQCGDSCIPQACPANIKCGPWGDGCGGSIPSCGTCPPGETCGGGGVNGECGSLDGGACQPQMCPANIQCGPWGDGCGGTISCGDCPPGETCGGGGVNGQCGVLDGGVCIPQGCAPDVQCGPSGDGCGNLIKSCGTCTPPQTCGGGGVDGQCGGGACTPLTCQQLGYNCGPAGDGCGGPLSCGTCTPPDTCGGGGAPGVCGSPTIPK